MDIKRLALAFDCPECRSRELRAEMKWNRGVPHYSCDVCRSRFGIKHPWRHMLVMCVAIGLIIGVADYLVGSVLDDRQMQAARTVVVYVAVLLAFIALLWPRLARAYMKRFVVFEKRPTAA